MNIAAAVSGFSPTKMLRGVSRRLRSQASDSSEPHCYLAEDAQGVGQSAAVEPVPEQSSRLSRPRTLFSALDEGPIGSHNFDAAADEAAASFPANEDDEDTSRSSDSWMGSSDGSDSSGDEAGVLTPLLLRKGRVSELPGYQASGQLPQTATILQPGISALVRWPRGSKASSVTVKSPISRIAPYVSELDEHPGSAAVVALLSKL